MPSELSLSGTYHFSHPSVTEAHIRTHVEVPQLDASQQATTQTMQHSTPLVAGVRPARSVHVPKEDHEHPQNIVDNHCVKQEGLVDEVRPGLRRGERRQRRDSPHVNVPERAGVGAPSHGIIAMHTSSSHTLVDMSTWARHTTAWRSIRVANPCPRVRLADNGAEWIDGQTWEQKPSLSRQYWGGEWGHGASPRCGSMHPGIINRQAELSPKFPEATSS
jgi:hypothetical protein